MKVSELIDNLKEYNQDAEITLTTSETIYLSYICDDSDNNTFQKKTTPIVFIEGCDYEDV